MSTDSTRATGGSKPGVKTSSVRAVAARAIASVLSRGVSLNEALPPALDKVAMADRALLQTLCYGTLRFYPRLERLLEVLLEKPLKPRDADLQALLACALYQLVETRVPDHATVDQSVKVCKSLKKSWAKGLVNGVLRRFIREREQICDALASDPVYRSAHPAWLEQRIRASWPESAGAILDANNHQGPLTLRVNREQLTRDDYLPHLSQAGIEALSSSLSEDAVVLKQASNVHTLPGFDQGWASVQDEAAQLAAPLLDLAPGQRVLDACCAPGGKTCHLLEREPAVAEVLALDIDARRLTRVEENARRLGVAPRLLCADAADVESWWDGRAFDRILLDAPCSASGVIRRHPDIKMLRQPKDIEALAAVQTLLLERLWPLLRVGGKLLYGTCSVLAEENDGVISRFIASQNNADPLPISCRRGRASAFGWQLFPERGGQDGFYYSLLQKMS